MEPEDDSYLGSGFRPSEEKIIHCLEKKRLSPALIHFAIEEINFYKYEPWDLPWKSKIKSKEQVWYFFNKPYYKYANSNREHRRTNEGYWKITGKGSKIKAKESNEVIGSKTILLFYRHGPDPKEAKTEWVMHQYHANYNPEFKEDFVVCRIERKRDSKHRISTNEGQPSQHSVSSSRITVTGNIFSGPTPPPSQQLVSNRNHHETQSPPSDHLISGSQNNAADITFPESQPPPNYDSISYSTIHTPENISPESELPSNDYPISDSTIDVTANTSLDPQLFPPHSFISSSENQTVENTFPKSQILPKEILISDSTSHFAKDISLDSQLNSSDHLSSYPKNHLSQSFLNYNMIPSPGNHIVGNTISKFQPSPNHDLICHPKNQIVKNNSPDSQRVPNHNMNYCSISHIVEKKTPEFQPIPSHDLISHSRNQVVPNASLWLQLLENQPLNSHCRYHNVENTTNFQLQLNSDLESQLLPNQYSVSQHILNSDSESQPPPNQYSVSQLTLNSNLESQPPPNQYSVSKSLLNSDLESQPPPNQHSINYAQKNTFLAKPLVSAELNAGNSYNLLDNASFSAQQSPICPEQGSSYSSVCSNDCNLWNSEFDIEQVDNLMNPERAFQEDYSFEGIGQTVTPDLNSIKSDGGVSIDDSIDMVNEYMDEWVNKLSENITSK